MFRLRIARHRFDVRGACERRNESDPVWRDDGGRVFAHGETRRGVSWMHMPGVASFRLSGEGMDVDAFPDDEASRARIRESFRKTVVPVAAHVRGHEVLHASAAKVAAGVVGLCGPSQSGKSTLAYAMARRGHDHWSDDALIHEIDDEGVHALRLPFSVRLREPTARHFAAETVPLPDPGDPERGYEPVERAQMAALCVLEPSATPGPAAVLCRLKSGEAFRAVIPHAFYFDLADAARTRRMVRQYLALVSRVPVYLLRYSTGLNRLGEVLDAVEHLRAA